MAKKPTLNDITISFADVTQLNQNWDKIEAAFENTLSRDGSTPNTMLADIDLNSNDILNVANLNTTALYINGTLTTATVNSIPAGSITDKELAANSVVSVKIADGAVTPSKLSNGDFGDFTVASGVANLDSGVVENTNLGAGAVTADKLGDIRLTRAQITSTNIDPSVNEIRTSGYNTPGDGGGATYKRVGAEPSHDFKVQSSDGAWWEGVVDRALSALQMGAVGDDSTDNAVPLGNWMVDDDIARNLFLPLGTFQTASGLIATDTPFKIEGAGWQYDSANALSGSIIKAASTGVADLLAIQSTTPGSGSSTDISGLLLAELGLIHRGTGTGLKINNITKSTLRNVVVECNNEGATGIETDNWAFFLRMEECAVFAFTNKGLVLSGAGNEHVIRDCHISSSDASATVGMEINVEGARIEGGQINVNRTDNAGIGVLFNNTAGTGRYAGTAMDVLSETDIGFKITGDTNAFNDVEIIRPFLNLSLVTTGVIFDRAVACRLVRPQVKNPGGGGTLCEWTANSIDCGLVCDIIGAQAPITVNASATRAWKRVIGRITVSERDNSVTTDSNLLTICEDVEALGECRHNGTAWDRHRPFLSNNAATSFTPPWDKGVVEVWSDVIGAWVQAQFDTAAGSMEALVTGSKGAVNATNGTLTGSTGSVGNLTLRANSGDGKVYIENRVGSGQWHLVRFTKRKAS